MINTSEACRAAIVGDIRQLYLKAIIDIISPDITYGAIASSGESVYSQSTKLYDKNIANPDRYVTCEKNRWTLDGSFEILPNEPSQDSNVGFLSSRMSGSDTLFSAPTWVKMAFSNVSVLQALTVVFPKNEYDGIPVDFKVEVFSGDTAYFTKDITGNSAASLSLEGFTVYDPTAIQVTVTRWSIPYRYFRMVEIVPGILEEWEADDLAEVSINQEVSFSCLSLPYGTCTIRMDNQSRRFEPRSKNGVFQSIEDRQGIPFSIGVKTGTVAEYVKVGTYYQFSGGWKTGDNGITMQWDLVDILGLLAERDFVVPSQLPTTLEGWITCVLSHLGPSFANRYLIDDAYKGLPVTASSTDDVAGRTCGDIVRFACMATGTFPRADASTGYLAAQPLWGAGSYIDLDNMNTYPILSANEDVAYITFNVYDGNGTICNVSGNNTASSNSTSVDNPFLHTRMDALKAAQNILMCYGGNLIEVSTRGNPSMELGDVDSVQLDESQATSARRFRQQFSFSNGVMTGVPATLLQADGAFLYKTREVIAESGTWTAPAGITSLRIILVGGGDGGTAGTDGSFESAGVAGTCGVGGKVLSQTININSGQSFQVSIGAGGISGGGAGGATIFGRYTSESGQRFNGFTDISSGDVFARDAVNLPLANSGDGGAGGRGGRKGEKHTETTESFTLTPDGLVHTVTTKDVTDVSPGKGTAGKPGGSGCVVVYWDKELS